MVLATGPAAALDPLSLIGGVPMLAWAVSALRAGGAADQLVVVVDPVGGAAPAGVRAALDRSVPGHGAQVVAGGPGRHAAVHRALSTVESRIETVVLHEVCRPLAAGELVARVLDAVRAGAAAAVPAVDVTETVKELDRAGRVAATVPRELLRRVQTPQAVRRSVLAAAHAGCRGDPVGDDELALTPGGTAAVTVDGDHAAFPVASPADLALAEAVIGGSREGVRRPGGRPGR